MMNKFAILILTVILVVVSLNFLLTLSILKRQSDQTAATETLVESSSMKKYVARTWGKKVIALYNEQDYRALYRLFNDEARVKISEEQLQTQLTKLHELFGDIEEHAYSSSAKVGTKGDKDYYQLFFKLRVSGKHNPATMTLSVVDDDEISLYGLRINSTESLD
jgi:hypothetical protein